MVIRRSRKAEVFWWWLRRWTVLVQLLPWRWSPMIKLYFKILLSKKNLFTKMNLEVWLESAFTYNFNFVAYLGYIRISPFFPYRPSLRFKAQVPSNFYVRVYESSIRTYTIEACRNTFECSTILKFEFRDLEMPRSNGGDLEIVLCGCSVYHED